MRERKGGSGKGGGEEGRGEKGGRKGRGEGGKRGEEEGERGES